MAFLPPILLIRRNLIVRKLRNCGAVSKETAKTLAQAGIVNPNRFSRITDVMVKKGIIHRTDDMRFYVEMSSSKMPK